jgi:hypothetical protein
MPGATTALTPNIGRVIGGKVRRPALAEGFNHPKLVNLCVVALAAGPVRYSASIVIVFGNFARLIPRVHDSREIFHVRT